LGNEQQDGVTGDTLFHEVKQALDAGGGLATASGTFEKGFTAKRVLDQF
jgi:hypothetical protein